MAPGKEAAGVAKESMEYLSFVQTDLASLLNPSKLLSDSVQSPRLVLSDNTPKLENVAKKGGLLGPYEHASTQGCQAVH